MCGSRGCVCVLSAHDSTCFATRKSHSNFQTMASGVGCFWLFVPNVKNFWTFPFTPVSNVFGNYAAIKWITLAFFVCICCWVRNKSALSQINNDQKKNETFFINTCSTFYVDSLYPLSHSTLRSQLVAQQNNKWTPKSECNIRIENKQWTSQRIGANTREKRKCKHAKKLECIQFSSHKQTRKLQAHRIIAPSMYDCVENRDDGSEALKW